MSIRNDKSERDIGWKADSQWSAETDHSEDKNVRHPSVLMDKSVFLTGSGVRKNAGWNPWKSGTTEAFNLQKPLAAGAGLRPNNLELGGVGVPGSIDEIAQNEASEAALAALGQAISDVGFWPTAQSLERVVVTLNSYLRYSGASVDAAVGLFQKTRWLKLPEFITLVRKQLGERQERIVLAMFENGVPKSNALRALLSTLGVRISSDGNDWG